MPDRSWKADPREAAVTSIFTTFELKAFLNEVLERIRRNSSGKDPDGMASPTDEVEEKYVEHEAVEAPNKAAAGKNERRREDKPLAKKGDGQQALSSAPVNTRDTCRAPVNGHWHCGDAHRQIPNRNGRQWWPREWGGCSPDSSRKPDPRVFLGPELQRRASKSDPSEQRTPQSRARAH